MAVSRARTPKDERPSATVVPLPGLGAPHSELAKEAAVVRWTKVHGHDVAYRQAGTGPLLAHDPRHRRELRHLGARRCRCWPSATR